jgi:hypothetical protein
MNGNVSPNGLGWLLNGRACATPLCRGADGCLGSPSPYFKRNGCRSDNVRLIANDLLDPSEDSCSCESTILVPYLFIPVPADPSISQTSSDDIGMLDHKQSRLRFPGSHCRWFREVSDTPTQRLPISGLSQHPPFSPTRQPAVSVNPSSILKVTVHRKNRLGAHLRNPVIGQISSRISELGDRTYVADIIILYVADRCILGLASLRRLNEKDSSAGYISRFG